MAARGETKLYFPGLGGIYETLVDWGYPLLRATAGLMLLPDRPQACVVMSVFGPKRTFQWHSVMSLSRE
jgi:hypothetical protein